MRIGVQNIVTSKHATYLEFPPLGFEPRTDSLVFKIVGSSQKLVPGKPPPPRRYTFTPLSP